MCKAAKMLQLPRFSEPVIERQSVADDLAAISSVRSREQGHERFGVAVRHIVEQDDAPTRGTCRSDPHVMLAARGFRTLQNLKRRLVKVDVRLFEHRLVHQIDDRHDLLAADGIHPHAHRAGTHISQAQPLELLALAGQGQAIVELCRRYVGQERGARHRFRQQLQRYRGDLYPRMVAAARILRPHVLHHNELRRRVFVLFRDFLPDTLKRRAVDRADLLVLRQIVHHLFAREVLRYRLAARLGVALVRTDALSAGLVISRRDRGQDLGLVEQHSLVG